MNQGNPNSRVWLPLYFALTLAVGLAIGFRVQDPDALRIRRPAAAGSGPTDEILRYIRAKYVDETDTEALYETGINAMLDELDPHSNYIPARDLRAINENMEGNFEGIGIEYLVVDDTITVVSAIPEGPSDRAGLRPGDQILYVGDSLVTGVDEYGIDPPSLMRGAGGTDVTLGVRRGDEPDLRTFTITRDAIPVYAVDAAYNIDEETTYIRINTFSSRTYDEFVRALEQYMEKGGASRLILDLRGNPGGYLQQATKLLSQLFVQKGLLLVYTEGSRSRRVEYKTNGRAFYNIRDVAILVDGGSASASEIVAGAIQDHDRGIIVGRRTFGKGLVQEQYPLQDGGALRLTIARYYTPSGRSIQRAYGAEAGDYDDDLSRRFDRGELTGQATAEVDSSLLYYTDGGHPVFGGGGITPDHYVALDSSQQDPTFLRLRQEIPAYVFRYARQHPELADYADLADFRARFRPDFGAVLRNGLRPRARATYDEPLSPTLTPGQRAELALLFRARLARHRFGPAAYFEVYNEADPVVQQALELLDAPNPVAAARR